MGDFWIFGVFLTNSITVIIVELNPNIKDNRRSLGQLMTCLWSSLIFVTTFGLQDTNVMTNRPAIIIPITIARIIGFDNK